MPGICPPYGIELLVGRSVDLELIPQPLGQPSSVRASHPTVIFDAQPPLCETPAGPTSSPDSSSKSSPLKSLTGNQVDGRAE